MGNSVERSKKKVQIYKKAFVHFLLCFVMGFFTGFAPTGKSSIFSSHFPSNQTAFSPESTQLVFQENLRRGGFNRTLLDETPEQNPSKPDDSNAPEEETERSELVPRRLIIVVTPTRVKDKLRGVNLRRLANTLRLVPPPLLWIVVEQKHDSSEVSEILRRTGIMYRHLVFKDNFTDVEVEMEYQRNLALNHIEHHRLSGIVHFAGLSNVYDLRFFNEIRAIEVFGTWPMAVVGAGRKRVTIEGPVCDSSDVVGWHLRRKSNLTDPKPPVRISGFGFNSSILWDPERWGRPSSVQDTTQTRNPIKFVKNEVLEEETKLIGIPSEGCSKIMLWSVHIPKRTKPRTIRLPVTLPNPSKR
ncbi:1,4-beta-D-xylan synthase [Bertholletia excelsa]